MALINCPECGKEISDQAASCPNCGFQLTNPANQTENTPNNRIQNATKPGVKEYILNNKWIWVVAGAILIAICLFVVMGNKRPAGFSKEVYQAAKAYCDAGEKYAKGGDFDFDEEYDDVLSDIISANIDDYSLEEQEFAEQWLYAELARIQIMTGSGTLLDYKLELSKCMDLLK